MRVQNLDLDRSLIQAEEKRSETLDSVICVHMFVCLYVCIRVCICEQKNILTFDLKSLQAPVLPVFI